MGALVRRDAHDPELRQLALELVSGCGGHQFECEIERLFDFVRDEITYRKDSVDREHVQDSRRTLALRTGDCASKSVLLASLLGSIGHRASFIVIGHDPDLFSHVFVEAHGPRGRTPLDPTPEAAIAGWSASAPVRWRYRIWFAPRRRLGEEGCVPGTWATLPSGERAYCRTTEETVTIKATPDEGDNSWAWWLAGGALGLLVLRLLK
jgi:hypothetical protein